MLDRPCLAHHEVPESRSRAGYLFHCCQPGEAEAVVQDLDPARAESGIEKGVSTARNEMTNISRGGQVKRRPAPREKMRDRRENRTVGFPREKIESCFEITKIRPRDEKRPSGFPCNSRRRPPNSPVEFERELWRGGLARKEGRNQNALPDAQRMIGRVRELISTQRERRIDASGEK